MKRWHALAAAAVIAGCTENLPSGPESFTATVHTAVAHDTIVVGDSSTATVQATDAAGNIIQGVQFKWTSSDSSTISPRNATAIAGDSGHVFQVLLAKKPGRATVTAFLTDARFNAAPFTRNETAVVGGVRILSSRDTTLTALNDTAMAIAEGLVRVNGVLVPRASQGIRWTHLGTRTASTGQSDTIKFVAHSNGADTLIATSDLCLAGAKCADTAIVRVNQQLIIAVAPRAFSVFSFGDSVGPAVTLADRRGSGLVGTSVRLVPVTAADSAIVSVTAPIGTSNFATGALAVPRLVSTGNGTARVAVLGIGADGSIVASDTISETVRQVARLVNAEPLRAVMTPMDSIPMLGVARDARGFAIPDASVTLAATGTTFGGLWAGPNSVLAVGTTASITPTLSGVALPANNPLAPQIAPTVNSAFINIAKVDTLGADTAVVSYSATVVDSTGQAAIGSWVRFRAQGGGVPDSVQVNSAGLANVTWSLRRIAGTYTLTGVRSAPTLATLSDSTGRIVERRSVVVVAGKPVASASEASVASTTVAHGTSVTVTILLFDQFGNAATGGTSNDFTIQATTGSISGVACANGTCQATYTAPAAAGNDQISVRIGGTDIIGSPIQLTIN